MNLKNRSILAVVLVVIIAVMSLSMALTASAGHMGMRVGKHCYEANLTDTQTYEFRGRFNQARNGHQTQADRLASLTDSQKAELEKIEEKISAAHKELIDKYEELGIITADEATVMKGRVGSAEHCYPFMQATTSVAQ